MKKLLLAALGATSALATGSADARPRWTEVEAANWYAKQPWLVGANYTPASAINQLSCGRRRLGIPSGSTSNLALRRVSA
jgi:hypothetical protein